MTRLGTEGSLFALGVLLVLALGCEEERSPSQEASSAATPSDTLVSDTASSQGTSPDTAAAGTTGSGAAAAPSESEETPDTSAQTGELSAGQKQRLAPSLRRLVRGEEQTPNPVEPVGTRDGAPVYGVMIECSDPAALREAGVPLVSVQGTLITARLTLDQIRTAAAVDAVQSIRAARSVQHHSPSTPNRNPSPGGASAQSASQRS